MKHFAFFILASIILLGCGLSSSKKEIQEGMIEYEVTYLDSPKEKPFISMLPRTVMMGFKKDNSVIKIEGLMGLFSFSYITLLDKNKNYTQVRICDKNYVYETECGNTAFGYSLDSMDVVPSEETQEICGFKCQKSEIRFKDKRPSFFVYSTNEIGVETPNINTPFHAIDGVLLDFQILLNGVQMHFKAINVQKARLSEKEFAISKQYIKVSRNQIDSVIKGFQNTQSVKN